MITSIPLSKLVPSPLNVRKTGGQSVDDLAASIRAHGLLQNLTVAAKGGKYEVVAGGRRLRALQRIEKEDGKLPDALKDGIPCMSVLGDDAHDASLAENVVREAMHPADQFDAFHAMAGRGHGVSAIAAAFGCPESVVKQRLKLAKVAPALIEAYRNGDMTLETLQTFSITDDRKQQERVWKEVGHTNKEYQAENVRRRLVQSEIDFNDSDEAQFVGLAAYEAAGGFIRRDMFTKAIYVDRGLVEKLVTVKLDDMKARMKAEGWGWVEVKRDYVSIYSYQRKKSTKREATAEEQDAIAALQAERAPLQERINVLQAIEDEDLQAATQDEFDQLDVQVNNIDSRITLIKDGMVTFSSKAKASSGAIIELYNSGLRIHRGLVKEADAKRAAKEKQKAKAGTTTEAPESTELSNTMVERLTGYRTAALQLELATRADVALALLAWELLQSTFGVHWYLHLGSMNATPYRGADFQRLGVAADYAPIEDLFQLTEEWRGQIPEDAGDALRWVFNLPADELQNLLAICTACAFNGTFGSGAMQSQRSKRDMVEILVERLQFDMAKHWAPTVDSFLGAVPKAIAIEAVTEACGAENAKKLVPLKKGDAAKLAEEMLEDRGWLPAPLRISKENGRGA